MGTRRVLAMAITGTLLAACSTTASNSVDVGNSIAPGNSAAAGNGINATLVEWSITLAPAAGASGETTFTIQNNGAFTHEFVVVKTDLAADALPVKDTGEVNQDNAQLTAVDEAEAIAAGTSKTLTVTLAPGHYVVFCNLFVDTVSHYQKGLHADITVT